MSGRHGVSTVTNNRLPEILVCSLCKGTLQHDRANNELIRHVDRLVYLIRDSIPVMLVDEACQTVEGTPVDPA